MSGADPAGPAAPSSQESATPALDITKLAAARLWATHRFPYLASAVFASPVIPAPGSGRLTIDRWWRVHADPEVVGRAEVAELGGELLHLCAHVLRDHAERADHVGLREQAELHHWVDAADAEIADDFPSNMARLSETVEPETLGRPRARLAEEYYRSGDVRPDSTNDCGSGAHGRPAFDEPPPDDPDRSPGVERQEQEMLRRRVADAVADSADQAPPGLRAWADSQRRREVDWRRELAAVLRRSLGSARGAVDYSYHRPSRRASCLPGVILPSLRQPVVEVVVVCDTSASVSEAQLGAALDEVDAVLSATGTRAVRVVTCDDAAHAAQRISRGRDLILIGGGGTDLRLGLDAAMALRPPPQTVVLLTDGFTPWPERGPRAEVVVGLLQSDPSLGQPPDPPEWARWVSIPTTIDPAPSAFGY